MATAQEMTEKIAELTSTWQQEKLQTTAKMDAQQAKIVELQAKVDELQSKAGSLEISESAMAELQKAIDDIRSTVTDIAETPYPEVAPPIEDITYLPVAEVSPPLESVETETETEMPLASLVAIDPATGLPVVATTGNVVTLTDPVAAKEPSA